MRQAKGFSLIELMVAVVVIAILASIAYPAYQDYVRRAQLTEAFSSLSDFRMRMEQYFQDNRSYSNGGVCGAALPTPPNAKFTYGCVTDAATYTATATGNSDLLNNFVFDINQRNLRRTVSVYPGWGTLGAPEARWIDRKP